MNIKFTNERGEVTLEPGQWWDAIAQTIIERGATVGNPLRLGNASFWRSEGITCYLPATSKWNVRAISDDLAEIIAAGLAKVCARHSANY